MESMVLRGPFWLGKDPVFPPAELAHESGLLAVGGDLRPERLLAAYRSGIFPWPLGEVHDPMFWFSPDPRFVLRPAQVHVGRSLRKVLRARRFEVRFDSAFEEVMRACAQSPRRHERGTWISEPMIAAYTELHRLGWGHSVESFRGGRLVGGLYGVAIGGAFFGESMFYTEPDASKVAFVTLAIELAMRGFRLIDCQQETAHLARFGARPVPRRRFLRELERALAVEVEFPRGSGGSGPEPSA
jgi:leucyl/phenylalanyl-tRNA--protein transferase